MSLGTSSIGVLSSGAPTSVTLTNAPSLRITSVGGVPAPAVGGTLLNHYDTLDQLVAQSTGLGTIAYEYDALGRRTTMTASGQPPVGYAYDSASRLTAITQASQLVQLQYDLARRRTRLTLPNQVSTEYQYDAASRITAVIHRNAAGPLGDLTYQYDPTGNRLAVGGSFARTLLPNSVPTATYDAANRQLAFGDKTMTFDANGNLVSLAESAGQSVLTWGARDQLRALSTPVPSATTFVYDPLGRRATKTVDGTTARYLYDGLDVVEEQGEASSLVYLRSLFIDEPLVRAGTEFYLRDALGSTLGLVGSDGVITTSYAYDPFGRPAVTGAATGNTFTYTGCEIDQAGLYYYRARYYSPHIHRFTAEDPVGFEGGVNLYAYARDNPLRWVDPRGLDVTISRWGCCVGFDHVGIGVNTDTTVGFYPVHPRWPFDHGVVLEDPTRNTPDEFKDSFTIKTTPEQDARIQAYIDQRTNKPGHYNALSGRHCGGFVQDALKAGGISPFGDIASPETFFEALKALNNAGVNLMQTIPGRSP